MPGNRLTLTEVGVHPDFVVPTLMMKVASVLTEIPEQVTTFHRSKLRSSERAHSTP